MVSSLRSLWPWAPDRRTPAVDVDMRHAEAAEAIDRLAVDQLGDGPLRFGQPPKRLRLCRTEVAFPKIASRDLVLPRDQPGDKSHKAELLANGQQFVAFGIHLDVGLPYTWPNSSELDLDRQDLPPIDEGIRFRCRREHAWAAQGTAHRALKEKAWSP
jgi:hypothetical protein